MNKEDSLIDELLETYKEYIPRSERVEVEERRKVLLSQLESSHPAKLLDRIKLEVRSKDAYYIKDLANDILLYSQINIDDLLVDWMENGAMCVSSHLFRDAGPKASEALFKQIENNDSKLEFSCVTHLAWLDDKRAVKQFALWKNQPPHWSKEYYLPIDQFSRFAGWELDENSEKRMLYSTKCFALDVAFLETDPADAEACHLCQRPLLHLQIPAGFLDEVIPEAFGFEILRIPFCNICCRYEYGSMSVLQDGKLVLDLENLYKADVPKWMKKSPKLYGDIILKRETQSRDPLFAVEDGAKYKQSQVGGFPTWVQDPEYLKCPTCKQLMFFILQFTEEEIFDRPGEDTFYVFFCTFCKDRFYVTQQFT